MRIKLDERANNLVHDEVYLLWKLAKTSGDYFYAVASRKSEEKEAIWRKLLKLRRDEVVCDMSARRRGISI